MFDELKKTLRGVILDDELYTLLAKVWRKEYDALIKEGFTPEQTIKIIAAQGVGIKIN
jgi:hypothetical protein